jgi:hypothetical protein
LEQKRKPARKKNFLHAGGCYSVLVPAIIVAIGSTMNPACGIAEAEFAAAFVITAASAELSAIESSKQPATASLARDGSQRVLCRYRSGRGILRRIGYAGSGATIGIANQHATDHIHGDVIKVEQIAARIASAAVPDTAALHRV